MMPSSKAAVLVKTVLTLRQAASVQVSALIAFLVVHRMLRQENTISLTDLLLALRSLDAWRCGATAMKWHIEH
jgi:hypothetical protein